MRRINSITFAGVLALASLLPTVVTAQGKGKGGGNARGGPEKAAAQGPQKVDRGQDKAHKESVDKPAKSTRGDDNSAAKGSSGKEKAQTIRGGVRGIERRSDRANAVAAGPRPAPVNSIAGIQFLNAKEVKRFNRDLRRDQVSPDLRNFISSNRISEQLAGGALAYAIARGIPPTAFLLTPASDLVEMKNKKGMVLFALRDDDARSLGAWRVSPLSNKTGEGAPSFCRSGAGHPVWGRQWCIDKGFGLGSDGRTRWGRTQDISDLRWNGDLATGYLTRDALLNVLGPTAFNRLALHAVTLGLVNPLVGQWRTDTSGQRLLVVSSGVTPVAEIADFNNDRRADLMLVALRPW